MNAPDMLPKTNDVSAFLPPDARAMLIRAANEAKTMDNQVDREAHIEAAIARVHMKFPRYFK